MKERPILFSDPMVRAIIAGTKTQTRRPVGTMDRFGSAPRDFWEHADLSRAWVEGKGSGSEYLKVSAHDAPDCERCGEMWWAGTVHRCYAYVAPAGTWDEAPEPGYTPPASQLWVREAWRVRADQDHLAPRDLPHIAPWYCATGNGHGDEQPSGCAGGLGRRRPGMFMPRWASRITLEVTGVRVERLQDITEEDARAEGVRFDGTYWLGGIHPIKGTLQCWPDARTAFSRGWDVLNGKRAPWASNPWCWAITFRRLDQAAVPLESRSMGAGRG